MGNSPKNMKHKGERVVINQTGKTGVYSVNMLAQEGSPQRMTMQSPASEDMTEFCERVIRANEKRLQPKS